MALRVRGCSADIHPSPSKAQLPMLSDCNLTPVEDLENHKLKGASMRVMDPPMIQHNPCSPPLLVLAFSVQGRHQVLLRCGLPCVTPPLQQGHTTASHQIYVALHCNRNPPPHFDVLILDTMFPDHTLRQTNRPQRSSLTQLFCAMAQSGEAPLMTPWKVGAVDDERVRILDRLASKLLDSRMIEERERLITELARQVSNSSLTVLGVSITSRVMRMPRGEMLTMTTCVSVHFFPLLSRGHGFHVSTHKNFSTQNFVSKKFCDENFCVEKCARSGTLLRVDWPRDLLDGEDLAILG